MRRAAGFSLLELVAVLSIFALVALIGVQVLQATIRSSERLSEISDDSADLARAVALLRQDLDAALPMVFTDPNGADRASLVAAVGEFALTVGGLARLESNGSGQGRVRWRFDAGSGQMLRQVWTTRQPGSPRSVSAPVTVLDNVRSLELASYAVQGGWRPGFSADPREITKLPLGLRVRVDHARFGEIVVTVSLR